MCTCGVLLCCRATPHAPCPGLLFGGRLAAIQAAAEMYDLLLADVLAKGHYGGFDVLLTILHHRFPELVRGLAELQAAVALP